MVIEKLVKLANDLDSKGLYEEASAIDDIILSLAASARTVYNFPPDEIIGRKWPSVHNFGPDEIIGRRDNPKMRRHIQNLISLRKELGLNPSPKGPLFDREVVLLLQKYYPGAWKPGKKQQSAQLLSAVKQQKQQQQQKEFEIAEQKRQKGVAEKRDLEVQPPSPKAAPRDPGAYTVSPDVMPHVTVPNVPYPLKEEKKD